MKTKRTSTLRRDVNLILVLRESLVLWALFTFLFTKGTNMVDSSSTYSIQISRYVILISALALSLFLNRQNKNMMVQYDFRSFTEVRKTLILVTSIALSLSCIFFILHCFNSGLLNQKGLFIALMLALFGLSLLHVYRQIKKETMSDNFSQKKKVKNLKDTLIVFACFFFLIMGING